MVDSDKSLKKEKNKKDKPSSAISKSPKRILAATVIILFISQIVHNLSIIFSMSFYTNPEFFTIWSPAMMSLGNATPSMDFFYMSIGYTFISSLIFVLIYSVLGKSISGGRTRRGVLFGFMVFLIATIPYTFTTILILNLPSGLPILWAAENLIIYLVGGAFTGWIMAKPSSFAIKKEMKIEHLVPVDEDSVPDWMKQNIKQISNSEE